VEDLVRVGVADAAEHVRIGERPLQRVVLAAQRAGEIVEAGVEHLEAAGIVLRERRAPGRRERRAALRAGFGEDQRPGVEVDRQQTDLARTLVPGPSSGTGPAIIRWMTRNSSPSSSMTMRLPSRDTPTTAALGRRQRRLDRPQQKRRRQTDGANRLADYPRPQGVHVEIDVG
jgi:hypothetical protein